MEHSFGEHLNVGSRDFQAGRGEGTSLVHSHIWDLHEGLVLPFACLWGTSVLPSSEERLLSSLLSPQPLFQLWDITEA